MRKGLLWSFKFHAKLDIPYFLLNYPGCRISLPEKMVYLQTKSANCCFSEFRSLKDKCFWYQISSIPADLLAYENNGHAVEINTS